MKENDNNFNISRENKSHNIKWHETVYRTDLGKSSKIVSMTKQNKSSCIKKLNKHEYVDTRTGEIKQYNLDKPISIESVKRKIKKYEELVQYNFCGGVNELFITLTCRDVVTDLQIIKSYYNKFIKRIQIDYEDIECIALFEQNSSCNWHIHLFIKSIHDTELFIPHDMLYQYYWRYGAVYISKNLNTFKSLGHSKGKRQEKLERLTNFPKGEKMYICTKGIKTPSKEKMLFIECSEYNSNDYSITRSNTYTITNEETGAIVNQITTIMYKNNNNKI